MKWHLIRNFAIALARSLASKTHNGSKVRKKRKSNKIHMLTESFVEFSLVTFLSASDGCYVNLVINSLAMQACVQYREHICRGVCSSHATALSFYYTRNLWCASMCETFDSRPRSTALFRNDSSRGMN
jgi:hypothetical protein